MTSEILKKYRKNKIKMHLKCRSKSDGILPLEE